MLSFFYRYNTYINFLMNTLRFKSIKFGRNVIVNIHNKMNFKYGHNVWLAEGTRIDAFSNKLGIDDGVNICRNSYLAPEKSGIHIGKRTKIQEGARILGEVSIGNDVIIAPNFYVSSGIHVFKQAPYLLISKQDQLHEAIASPCVIEDDCWIGINVSVMPGVKISRGSIIGAGAVVTQTTEPYAIYGGVPAKKIGVRLSLQAKNTLNSADPEDLPYFYQGFDHYHYEKNRIAYDGIMTCSKIFHFYSLLPNIQNIRMRIKTCDNKMRILKHAGTIYEIDPHKEFIDISNVLVHNNLIEFHANDNIIIKKIEFN